MSLPALVPSGPEVGGSIGSTWCSASPAKARALAVPRRIGASGDSGGGKGGKGGNGGQWRSEGIGNLLLLLLFFLFFFFFFLLFSSSLWFIIIIIFYCSCCSCLLPLGHCRSGVAEGLASAGRGWERCQVDLGIFGLSNCYPSNRMEQIYHINHIYIFVCPTSHSHVYDSMTYRVL